MFLFAGFVPLVIGLAMLGFSIRALVREFTIASRVLRPSSCAGCEHEATHAMIASGRCPECGTLYMNAGVSTPQGRFKLHVKTSGAYAAALFLSLVAAGLSVAIFEALAAATNTDRSIQLMILWLATLLATIGAFIALIVLNRRKVRRAIADRTAKAEIQDAAARTNASSSPSPSPA
jgi:hypothetical protein